MHENRGVSTATDNTVATALTGATVWQKLTASNLTGTGNSFGAQLLQVQDQKTSGTSGDTSVAATWTKKTLQTTLTNEITSATLTSSVISLPAGTYWADGYIMNFAGDHARCRLQNTSDSATLVLSNTGYAISSVNHAIPVVLRGRFTLAGTKNIEFQYYMETSGVGKLGQAYAAPGVAEVDSDLCIWKIA